VVKISRMPKRIGAVALVFALSVASYAACAAGDPDHGKATAERWCTACHTVGPSGRGADVAPNFSFIARARDDAYLRTFLMRPHPPMPRFELSRQDIDDLAAYIARLRVQ
jgi:mono/diheme cytochrome c family protein